MTEQEIAERLAREPQPIQDIYHGLRDIVDGASMLDLEEDTPTAELQKNAASALADFEEALEFEAAVERHRDA
jgi:hypothetical protein